jgi:tRNA(Ile2) C34 agmatinyltransferase TiaS
MRRQGRESRTLGNIQQFIEAVFQHSSAISFMTDAHVDQGRQRRFQDMTTGHSSMMSAQIQQHVHTVESTHSVFILIVLMGNISKSP